MSCLRYSGHRYTNQMSLEYCSYYSDSNYWGPDENDLSLSTFIDYEKQSALMKGAEVELKPQKVRNKRNVMIPL